MDKSSFPKKWVEITKNYETKPNKMCTIFFKKISRLSDSLEDWIEAQKAVIPSEPEPEEEGAWKRVEDYLKMVREIAVDDHKYNRLARLVLSPKKHISLENLQKLGWLLNKQG